MVIQKGNKYYIGRHEDAKELHHVATIKTSEYDLVTGISYYGIFRTFYGKRQSLNTTHVLNKRMARNIMLQNAWVIAGSIDFQRDLMEIDDVP